MQFHYIKETVSEKNALILRSLYSLDVKKKNYNKHFTFGGWVLKFKHKQAKTYKEQTSDIPG